MSIISFFSIILYNDIGDLMINLILAVVPAIVLGGIFLFINRDNLTIKKLTYLVVLLAVGAIGSYICFRLEMHFGSYFKKVKDSNYWEILFYAIFGVAIFEEGYKLVVPLLITFKDKVTKGMDLLLYCVFSSIGFALFENIVFFALPYGTGVTVNRMFTAFPSHICNAIWMGLFLWLYANNKGIKRYFFLILSLVVPTLLHALYNSFIYGGNTSLQTIHLGYTIGLFICSILVVVYMKTSVKD